MNARDERIEETASKISSQSGGADFCRADLHIHSFGEGGSYDVKDPSMTVENIIDVALHERLSVISITDHNTIGNVSKALSYAVGKKLIVIPGVELSTPNGHLLVYFPTLRNIESFLGKLEISDDKRSCSQPMIQCLNLASQYEGFGIAAHIEVDSGFDVAMPKFDVHKENLLKCPNLMALEIKKKESENWYTDRDDNPDRKRLHNLRRSSLDSEDGYELPKVMNSDAHSLDALGKNASGSRKLTRLKMETLSFNALKIALLDSTARVRIEDLIPESIPHFVGMTIEGGFLDGQVIKFSKNLTCIIGGRGAGKSTLMESLRVCSGNAARPNLVDSEIWPDHISIIYEDEAKRQQVLSRYKEGAVINVTDEEFGLHHVPIESYGQGETAETIQHCDDDPNILLKFLDGFLDLSPIVERDEEIVELLIASQTTIERLELDVKQIPEITRAKTDAEAQLNALKSNNAEKIVALEARLAKERAFRNELIQNLTTLNTTVRSCLSDKTLSELVLELDGSSLAVGVAEFDKLKKIVVDFQSKLDGFSSTLQKEAAGFVSAVNEQLRVWLSKEADTLAEVEAIRKDLESKGIRLEMSYIRKVSKDVHDYSFKLVKLQTSKTNLDLAIASRKELIQERKRLKKKASNLRGGLAITLTKNLRSTVTDYVVTVKSHEGKLSANYETLLKTALHLRTSQVPKAYLIASNVPPLDLVDALRAGNHKILTDIVSDHDERPFTHSDAVSYFDLLKSGKFIFDLERCDYQDRPEVSITRETIRSDGSKNYVSRDFAKLSLGQQQAILLSIMLFSKSKLPLIIDQPEDNLDSQFIYKTFVKTLRVVKEKRQVIIVTHNANIAVLGDAELILPLKSTNESSGIYSRGSIDTPATKSMTCSILEGSDRAFKKRKEVYGF